MIAIVELVAKLAVHFLSFYMQKYAKDEAAKRDYIAFVEIMNRKGLTSVQLRMKAKEQIERVNELWKEENALKSSAESHPRQV